VRGCPTPAGTGSGLFPKPALRHRLEKTIREGIAGLPGWFITGNILLQFDGVFVDKSGGEPPPRERKQLRRLFAPVSARVIRALLENPGRIWTLTALSAESRASLRLTYQVVNALAEKDYVDKKRAAIALIRPGELLERRGLPLRRAQSKL